MSETRWRPRLYVQDKVAWEEQLSKQHLLTDEPAGVKEYDSALVLPARPYTLPEFPAVIFYEGGVIDKEGNFVEGTARKDTFERASLGLISGYDVPEEEIEYCDEEVIFGGLLRNQFGHFLVDSTSRLWYPATREEKRKVVFVEDGDVDFKFKPFLELAGFAEKYEIIKRPKRFKKVIAPEETSFSLTDTYRKEWVRHFDAIRKNVKPAKYKKIYLTRTAFSEDIVNEVYFEKFYERHGFHVISPEQHTLEEQVSFMKGAEEVVATAGSISDLILFAKSKTKITVFNRVKKPETGLISVLEAKDTDCILVDPFKNYLPTTHNAGCVCFVPNDNWNAYIKDEFNEDPDYDYIENEVPKIVVEYIERWGEWFQNKYYFNRIKNFNMNTLLTYINETKFNKRIRFKGYPISSKITNATNLARQRGLSSQEFTPVEDVWEDDHCLKMKGSIEKIPFLDWNRAKATMNLVGEDVDLNFPIETKISEDGKLNWETNIDTKILHKNFPEPKEEEQRQKQIGEFVIAITSEDHEELRLKLVSG